MYETTYNILRPTNNTFPLQSTFVGERIDVNVVTADGVDNLQGTILRFDVNGKKAISKLENDMIIVAGEDLRAYTQPPQKTEELNMRVHVHMTPYLEEISTGTYLHVGTVIRSDQESASKHGIKIIRLDNGNYIYEQEAHLIFKHKSAPRAVPEIWVDDNKTEYVPQEVPELKVSEDPKKTIGVFQLFKSWRNRKKRR